MAVTWWPASGTWDPEGAVQEWVIDDGDKLALGFDAAVDNRFWYGFSLTTAPVITVSGSPRPADEWMEQYVRPITQITTFATQRPQPMSWVTLYHTTKESPVRWLDDQMPTPDRELPAQLFTTDITQQPYEAGPTERSQMLSNSDGTLIRLGPEGRPCRTCSPGGRACRTPTPPSSTT
jgi:hypothetical protein